MTLYKKSWTKEIYLMSTPSPQESLFAAMNQKTEREKAYFHCFYISSLPPFQPGHIFLSLGQLCSAQKTPKDVQDLLT